jgi:hypothetical protein
VGVESAWGEQLGACECAGTAIEASSRDELAAAFAGRPACIQLADGAYGNVEVPEGFELVGASPDGVKVGALRFTSGRASACRMSVHSGVSVAASAEGRMQYVHVIDSPGDGVALEQGAAVRIAGSSITGSQRYGVSAFGARSVEVVHSLIDGQQSEPAHGGGPGIWVQCDDVAACASPPTLVLRDSIVRRNRIVGVHVVGAIADIERVHIVETFVGENFESGGGFCASAGSSVVGSGLVVQDNVDFGVLIDSSDAVLEDIDVSRNLRGVWVQHIEKSVRISGATLDKNEGVGLALRGETCATVVVEDAVISNTTNVPLPVLVTGVSAAAEVVGDGVQWEGNIVGLFRRVHLHANQRDGFVINGPASGVLEDVTLSGGDEDPGILQQCYSGGPQPTILGSTPPLFVVRGGSCVSLALCGVPSTI